MALLRKTAITNVRIFDGHGLTAPKIILINDGLITQIQEATANDSQLTSNSTMVDGARSVLLPGLIDAHIHLNTNRELQTMAQHGITTALDMATWPPSKIASLRSDSDSNSNSNSGVTDFLTPGLPATTTGSMHSAMLPIPPSSLLSTPADGRAFVAARLAEGADYIKIIADIPGPSQDLMNAISGAAHAAGKLVVVHSTTCATTAMALSAEADVLTHVATDGVLSDEAVARIVRDERIVVPTLTMMEAVTDPISWTGLWRILWQPRTVLAIIRAKRSAPPGGAPRYEHARANVTKLHKAGVPILAGTDAHVEPTSPFSVVHGKSLHRELELLVEAGLSSVEALRAATVLPAEHFGMEDRGAVEVGKRADLVLLKAGEDPVANITATRGLARVWCRGVEVDMGRSG